MATTARRRPLSIVMVSLAGLWLAGCATPPAQITGATAYRGSYGIGHYRVGSPYQKNGVWYFPAVDYGYDRTGLASWYGEAFEGRLTANGEIFELNRLTAAHTTLPMPSIVEVTNLENGRQLQLRVNDRGPFVDGRLIDVSRRAAQLLGFEEQGTTLVRVRVLKEESIAAAEETMRNAGQILVADAGAAATMTTPVHANSPPRRAAATTETAAAPAFAPAPLKPEPPRPFAPPPTTAPPVPSPVIAAAPAAASSVAAAASPAPGSEPPLEMAARPPRSTYRQGRSALSRFAFITPAEAAELPLRRPSAASPSTPASQKPNLPARLPTASAIAGQRIYVQAGAFSALENAHRAQSRLAQWGSAQVTRVQVHGVELYRVRLGPFPKGTEAERLLARVIESGYGDARLVGD